MTWLRKLTVRGTNIETIPNELSKLIHLQELDVSNSLLSRFDVNLISCQKLRHFVIHDNDLQELPTKLPPETTVYLTATPFRLYTGHKFKDLPSN